MAIEKIDTLVVGGGQAGLAMSEHLSNCGVPHLVLERNRIAERWRSGRWDSLVANGPAWHDRFPTMAFDEAVADTFIPKEGVAAYLEKFADQIKAPIRSGVEVKNVQKNSGQASFRVETSSGAIEARTVVCATGPFQRPIMPALVPKDSGITQIHSADYRNPGQLPEGAVLVVGGGASGVQIADELLRSGRPVFLSVGRHNRPPRAYRGRDYCWWLGVLGKWDLAAPHPGTEHVAIAVSGAYVGHTVDFRELAARGMALLGRAENYKDGVLTFEGDLVVNIAAGDANYLSVLDEADAYVSRNGIDLPEEPAARIFSADPHSLINPIRELNLAKAGITSIVWATGYAVDYSWLKVDAFNEKGKPKHQRGVSSEPGIYFIGLPWLSRRASSFIYGVWYDARYLADHIANQRQYQAYHHAAQSKS